MDRELLDWLNTYTYPNEAKFKDKDHARKVYAFFVDELLRQGTLHVNCFPSIHYEASEILFDILEQRGLFAFTGKLNMDQNSPEYYIEDTEQSIIDTERFIKQHQKAENIKTAIVPRFAITCSEKLLSGLGSLSKKYGVPVHSHMCEAVNEMKVTHTNFDGHQIVII